MEIFGQQISAIEIIGTLFGIAGVWLTVKKNIWCFPTGIINVVLYAILFYQCKLYADASLQVVYIILLIYGWIQWNRSNVDEKFVAGRLDARLSFALVMIGIVLTIMIGSIFKTYTDASLPYLDSALASASLIAQWLIAKRKIENWLVWIVADVVYVGMYIYKHLFFTTFLYAIFIILALTGWREWKKIFNERTA